ncbi:tRNA cyclic N6-threonylcarbamoyladenosine(37) synthase TcdA [Paraglaciecola chathamensis]|jgi:tRNA A37 threonylcarbamoyladenosine dehydratase|uniref:tRNA cyclic N6-threonylcarbamoyladenosine(37) synthase TcdA n=2 Tax=Paraglaciecola chathamensis TaxID=368405 RepID=A0ABS0WED5_9ALTE|nr:tRNA cyclic N6-threonylcarbamoyladenosine(37) synthase TcdA [Paraglaciecola chathamensis]MBJ2136840.1 tRNA cyclic N6-threonylcarbamoyladenosine(37) synthase TcdA [Paraglaciecola chathamensis]GAC12131.1 molybdopterin biosynthesis MoeB protein [Paraglaciecola chathamensis S18K6]
MSQFSQRFGGTQRLYGVNETQILQNSHVCVVGIGGVGSWVAEALARSAIGHITLIDLDDICVTNTNRQIHALQNTIGEAKVDAMRERILQINPECKVDVIEDFVTPDNAKDLLNKSMSYVVEATDSVKAKAAMVAHCKRNKIPVITIGGAGGQIDPTQIAVADLAKTIQDPLAAKLRYILRKEYGFTTNSKRRFAIECVFSTEQLRYPQDDGSVCQTKNLADGSVKLDCNNGFGASVAVTATFGFVAAARVMHKIIERAKNQSAS